MKLVNHEERESGRCGEEGQWGGGGGGISDEKYPHASREGWLIPSAQH